MSQEQNDQVFKYTVRAPKEWSAFTYFLFEASEGLCFYSTLPYPEGANYRDICFQGDVTTEKEFLSTLKTLECFYTPEFIEG